MGFVLQHQGFGKIRSKLTSLSYSWRWRRCPSCLHPHLFHQKTTAQVGIAVHSPAPCCSSQFFHPNVSANPRGQAFDFTQQFRLQDTEENKRPASNSLQLDQGISGIQQGLVPREVANENRPKSVKCIPAPKKMEQDFPSLGFISRKWITIILRGHFALTQ